VLAGWLGAGGITYLAACLLLGAEEIEMAKRALGMRLSTRKGNRHP